MSLEYEELMIDRLSRQSKSQEHATKEEKELQELRDSKQQLMMKQSQDYLETLFKDQASSPVSIKNAQITNSQSFRDLFLKEQFKPILATNITTLNDFFQKLDLVNENLNKLNIVENSLVSLHQLPRKLFHRNNFIPQVVPVFNIIPNKKFYAKTGTNIGNGEGDGYIQFQLKNIFGGAENLIFDAITGTKTQSSYHLNYNQPILNQSNYILENILSLNTRKLDWINCDVKTRGLTNRIYTQYSSNINHELIMENQWRSLINTGSKSLEVINQTGEDFKSSLIYNWRYDTRNNRALPTSGKYLRFGIEYNGLFNFNTYKYVKLVYESQFAYKFAKNHSLIFSNKSGILHSLNGNSSILDRFYIGGPNDVRSFTINGLGPKNYNSSIGGDYFLNGGISVISNIPKYEESNFKIHNFINFGKLLPINQTKTSKELAKDLIKEHSISYGFGLLFNHPVARFELNFVLPLAVHERDYTRKGIQYGIGISFL